METGTSCVAFVLGKVSVGFLAASMVPCKVVERWLVLANLVLDTDGKRGRLGDGEQGHGIGRQEIQARNQTHRHDHL